MGLLNDLQVKAAQPRENEYLLSDGVGLCLRVRHSGKAWVFRFRQDGKQEKLSLGGYPLVTLAGARKKARAAAERLANGDDPKADRRQEQERARVARMNTFELMARTWHAQARKDRLWSAGYAEKVIRHLELHIFHWLGGQPIRSIAATELVRCLHRIKDRGNLETAQRVREVVQQVFQYAVDIGALEPERNFVNGRTGGLPPPRSRHFAAITDPDKLGQLLRDIRGYKGNIITRAALQLSPILFQRPGQLRLVHWEDIDFEQALWSCPPEKMKMREWQKRDPRTKAHLVPLPRQAIAILQDLYPLTGPNGPFFRSVSRRSESSRYMSDNTINAALRALGYDTREQMTGHGFRATGRTLVRELLGYDREPLLHEVDAQNCLHGKWRASAFSFRCVGRDQIDQRSSRHHTFHLTQELSLARALGCQVQAQIGLFHGLDFLSASASIEHVEAGFMQTFPSVAIAVPSMA